VSRAFPRETVGLRVEPGSLTGHHAAWVSAGARRRGPSRHRHRKTGLGEVMRTCCVVMVNATRQTDVEKLARPDALVTLVTRRVCTSISRVQYHLNLLLTKIAGPFEVSASYSGLTSTTWYTNSTTALKSWYDWSLLILCEPLALSPSYTPSNEGQSHSTHIWCHTVSDQTTPQCSL
jgi:hypothetical protein